VALGGEEVASADDVVRIVTDRLLPGETVGVTVIRGGTGRRETVRVLLDERPAVP